MLLKEDFKKELLLSIGFEPVELSDFTEFSEESFVMKKVQYALSIGESRRGQFYYLTVSGNLLSVYATEPDGGGGSTPFTRKAVEAICKLQQMDAFQ